MSLDVFNWALGLGWLLLLIGTGLAFGAGIGLAVGGVALIVLTLLVAGRFGVRALSKEKPEGTD